MQIYSLHQEIDRLHRKFGHPRLCAIYGAGCVLRPRLMLIFMNPTARNVSANPAWTGIRAPWLGAKNIWQLFYRLNWLPEKLYQEIQNKKPAEWTTEFAEKLYRQLRQNKIYLTNLAKCTQADARPLANQIFKDHLEILCQEINLIKPKSIITFGNQVSSLVLGRTIKAGSYEGKKHEFYRLANRPVKIYPAFYPVGQGRRNLPLVIRRIRQIL